jgi:hypothetical protein
MVPSSKVTRSVNVDAAGWIKSRLGKFGESVTSVVPGGFEAYARVLHPADSIAGRGLVRWREVAGWSGLPLHPSGQFHSVALPPEAPGGVAPWHGAPEQGTLIEHDAERLVDLLRPGTTTPDECWFALWEGYGWLAPTNRGGARVHLPNRDYLLYKGPIEAAGTTALFGDWDQSPNLWWPADERWCVASEIDLPWTYVGGTADMVERLVMDNRIEALAIRPDEPIGRIEEWVERWVEVAVEELWTSGHATVATPRGTVRVSLTQPGQLGDGSLRMITSRPNGEGSGWKRLGDMSQDRLRRTVAGYVTLALTGLVES